MGIGSRKDWHRFWRIKDLTNFPSVGRGTTTSTWLIITWLWKNRSWLTTILHWMPERTLDLSIYGCIPFFSDVRVSLNEKLVSPPTSLYPYRAYIETLLSYGPAVKESQLTGVIWYKDTPGHQDKWTTDNKGFTSRKALTAQRKSVQMMGKLHLDLCCQEKYLLNRVDLKIKLRRSRNRCSP